MECLDWCFAINTQRPFRKSELYSLFPSGNQLVSGSADKSIRLWDTVTGQCLCIINGHFGSVQSVKYLTNGLQIVSGSSDKTVQIWNAVTGQHCQTFKGHLDIVYDLDLSVDGNLIASASGDTTVHVWNISSKIKMHMLSGHLKLYVLSNFLQIAQLLCLGLLTRLFNYGILSVEESCTFLM